MGSDDLISVIVPFYKTGKYLDRCIESLVNQTYENLEILLIDDGSPDDAGAIADAWKEKDGRIRVFHRSNGGQSAARNFALRMAQGKYFGFVDSDDYVEPHFVETLYSLLVKNNADISAVGYQMVSETILPVCDSFDPSCTEILDRHEAIRELFSPDKYRDYPCNKLFRKELFRGIEFPVGCSFEDIGTIYRLIDRCDRMVYNPIGLYYYYRRAGSIVALKDVKSLRDAFFMRKQRYLYVKDKYPDIESNYDNFFRMGLSLIQYLGEDEKKWLPEELRELWPRVKKTVSVKDKFKYFFCIHMTDFYCRLCRGKKRFIG